MARVSHSPNPSVPQPAYCRTARTEALMNPRVQNVWHLLWQRCGAEELRDELGDFVCMNAIGVLIKL